MAATVSSVIGFFLLACLGEVLRRRLGSKQKANKASADSVEMNNLGSGEAAPSDQKPRSKFVILLFWLKKTMTELIAPY